MTDDVPTLEQQAAAGNPYAEIALRLKPRGGNVAPIAPVQPTRGRWLADRSVVLREGRFPALSVVPVVADAVRDEPAMPHARRFISGREPILVLLGGYGSGKTTAATWAACEVGGSRPGHVRATTLCRAGQYDREFSGWVASRTMLVVDDLGMEYADPSGVFSSTLDELVDVAVSDRRRLVLNSHLAADGLKARLGDHIWSRICQRGASVIGQCGSVDLRKAG